MRTFEDERVPPFWFYHGVKFRQMIEFMKVPTDLIERCRVIRFEDIHNRTEPVMRSLVKWLNISWDPVLLESTFDGEPYWGVKGGWGRKYKPGEIPPIEALATGTRAFDESELQFKYLGFIDRLRLSVFCEPAFENWGYRLFPCSRALRSTLRRCRSLLLLLPSKLDRRCYLEDLKLDLNKQPKFALLVRGRMIAKSVFQFVRNKILFRREMLEIERTQLTWQCIQAVYLPANSDERALETCMEVVAKAA